MEPEVHKVIDELRQSRREDEVPMGRQPSKCQFERSFLVGLAGLEVPGRHRELVQIRKKPVHLKPKQNRDRKGALALRPPGNPTSSSPSPAALPSHPPQPSATPRPP